MTSKPSSPAEPRQPSYHQLPSTFPLEQLTYLSLFYTFTRIAHQIPKPVRLETYINPSFPQFILSTSKLLSLSISRLKRSSISPSTSFKTANSKHQTNQSASIMANTTTTTITFPSSLFNAIFIRPSPLLPFPFPPKNLHPLLTPHYLNAYIKLIGARETYFAAMATRSQQEPGRG